MKTSRINRCRNRKLPCARPSIVVNNKGNGKPADSSSTSPTKSSVTEDNGPTCKKQRLADSSSQSSSDSDLFASQKRGPLRDFSLSSDSSHAENEKAALVHVRDFPSLSSEEEDEDSLESSANDSGKQKRASNNRNEPSTSSDEESSKKEETNLSRSSKSPVTRPNLQCVKWIKQKHGSRQLQPPPTYRQSLELLDAFMNMPKEQQWFHKKAWRTKKKKEKDKIIAAIPGCPCSCCKTKSRKDKGSKRGKNIRSRRRSRRLKTKEAPTNLSTNVDVEVPEHTSLAHSSSRRQAIVDKNKSKQGTWKRQPRIMANLNRSCARRVREQGGASAMDSIFKA